MVINIERCRTMIVVRNAAGLYRMLYFQPMSHADALALLPQYGYTAAQVVRLEVTRQQMPLSLRDGIIIPKLLQYYDEHPVNLRDDSRHGFVRTREWLENLLQCMLPCNTHLCPLSLRTVKETFTLINNNHSAQ